MVGKIHRRTRQAAPGGVEEIRRAMDKRPAVTRDPRRLSVKRAGLAAEEPNGIADAYLQRRSQ
jgi:hypothetical protein